MLLVEMQQEEADQAVSAAVRVRVRRVEERSCVIERRRRECARNVRSWFPRSGASHAMKIVAIRRMALSCSSAVSALLEAARRCAMARAFSSTYSLTKRSASIRPEAAKSSSVVAAKFASTISRGWSASAGAATRCKKNSLSA